VSRGRVAGERLTGRDMERRDLSVVGLLYVICLKVVKKTGRRMWIFCMPAGVQTQHLPNTSEEQHRYSHIFVMKSFKFSQYLTENTTC
jgi:hypothetical protein